MNPTFVLTSERLELVVATPDALRAAAGDHARLAAYLNAAITSDWPHDLLDDALIPMADLLEQEARAGIERGIFTFWFIVLKQPRTLIGTIGLKGAPSQKTTTPTGIDNQAAAQVTIEAGRVDIGYGLVQSHQRRGYAREAVQRMLREVFAHPIVTTVVGETLEDLTASIRVMESCGFRRVSSGGTGYSGEENVIRYDLPRVVWENLHS